MERKKNWVEFDYLELAVDGHLFTGAIPLLFDTGAVLPAVFPPWAGSFLFNQPGELGLLCVHHVDAKLSADTRST